MSADSGNVNDALGEGLEVDRVSKVSTNPDNDKHAKFRDLAEKRTNRALEAIGRIGKLSNRQLYAWEESEVRKIVKALKDATAEVESRFTSPPGGRGGSFKL